MDVILAQACLCLSGKWQPVAPEDGVLLTMSSAQDIVLRSGLAPRTLPGAAAFNLAEFSTALPGAIRAADRTQSYAAAAILRRLGIHCASGLCLGASDLIFFPN